MFEQPDQTVPLTTKAQNGVDTAILGGKITNFQSQQRPKPSQVVCRLHSGHVFQLCYPNIWLKVCLGPSNTRFYQVCPFGPAKCSGPCVMHFDE